MSTAFLNKGDCRKAFEYKTVTVDGRDMELFRDELTARLNRWEKEGWELVSILPCLGASLPSSHTDFQEAGYPDIRLNTLTAVP